MYNEIIVSVDAIFWTICPAMGDLQNKKIDK
jgi:hypothetical protein